LHQPLHLVDQALDASTLVKHRSSECDRVQNSLDRFSQDSPNFIPAFVQ
jgi:hypothetical protein